MAASTTDLPTPPIDYHPKRGGARQTWRPTVTVVIKMTGADAAYFKARMDEQLAGGGEAKK